MKIVHGLAFPDADEFMVQELTAQGTYQIDHLEAALLHVTDVGIAIDGGAHVGTWSMRLATVFDRVLAFEPSPDTFECLQRNAEPYPNIECRPEALGAAPGFVTMALDAANTARANTGARFAGVGADVPVVTIDSLSLEHVGFLKLDVEGSEPRALAGAVETIRRCRPIILFENKWLWVRHFSLPKDAVSSLLRTLGYDWRASVSCDQIWGPR